MGRHFCFGDESNVRGKAFVKALGFMVGEWVSVCFLFDDCMGVGPLHLLFPRMFRVASNKETSVKECYVWVGNVVSWNISIRRPLHQSELMEHETLLSILTNILCKDSKDYCIWKLDST